MTPAAQPAITPTSAPIREPVDPVYRQIRDLVYKVSGIYKAEEKLYLLADGCGRRMKQVGARTYPGFGLRWARDLDHRDKTTRF